MTYGAAQEYQNRTASVIFYADCSIHDTQGEPNWQALTDKRTVQMIFMTVNTSHKQRGQATKIVVQ